MNQNRSVYNANKDLYAQRPNLISYWPFVIAGKVPEGGMGHSHRALVGNCHAKGVVNNYGGGVELFGEGKKKILADIECVKEFASPSWMHENISLPFSL